MTVQKAVAIAVIGFALAMQAAQIFPPGMPPNERFWPFVDWPMYSASFQPGARVSRESVRVVSCDGTGTSAEVTAYDMHVERFVFYTMMSAAADTGRRGEAMTDTLVHLVETKWRRPACALQIWQQTLVIGERGLASLDEPWQLVREQPIDHGMPRPIPPAPAGKP